jgi:hypothetical protein
MSGSKRGKFVYWKLTPHSRLKLGASRRSAPTIFIRGDSLHSRASFSPRLCGSAQCRRIVEIIKDALCGSGLNF